jgi:hypothetical protein
VQVVNEEHILSLVAVGAWVSYWSELQVVNEEHTRSGFENWVERHSLAQTRLVVAVGAWVSYWSEVQVVWGMQSCVVLIRPVK